MTVIGTTINSADANASPGFSGSPSGVQRVQLGNGGTEAPAALPGRGATARDYSTVTRISSADIGAGSGDIEARSPTGRPLAPSEIKPDSIVTVQGQSLKASLAERLGLLTKDGDGYRAVASAAPAAAPQGAQQTRSDEGTASAAPALPEAAAASLEALNAGGQDTHSAAVEFLDAGELSPAATARLAGRLGIEPEQVAQHVANVAEGFRSQAAEIVGGSEVLDLATHLFPDAMNRAGRAHALQGDVSGYTALAAKAVDHVVNNAASVESADADVTVRTVQGRHLVSGAGIPGGEITLAQAVRLGLVSVTIQR